MKKIAVIGMILALCLCFTACDNEKRDNLSDNISQGASDLGDDISQGVSDLGDDISQGASDLSDDISDGLSDLNPDKDPNDSSLSSQPASTRPAEIDPEALNQLDGTKRGWGQGHNVDESNRPTGCLQFQTQYGKYDAYYIGEKTKTIYLTFDEGYENGYTSKILDTLKEKKVPAVFFVTYDYCDRNPELIKRMISEGHVVGNHSWSHPSMPTVSLEKAKDEILKLHEYVKTNFGYEMTLFRPPMGEFSERTLALTQQLGYKSVFWSYAYQDWDPDNQIGAEAAYQKVTEAEHEGAIYLLHAVSKDNAEILGRVIDDMRGKGYTFSTL